MQGLGMKGAKAGHKGHKGCKGRAQMAQKLSVKSAKTGWEGCKRYKGWVSGCEGYKSRVQWTQRAQRLGIKAQKAMHKRAQRHSEKSTKVAFASFAPCLYAFHSFQAQRATWWNFYCQIFVEACYSYMRIKLYLLMTHAGKKTFHFVTHSVIYTHITTRFYHCYPILHCSCLISFELINFYHPQEN